eukprot:1003936-Karenia_brevis.AAC.1
MARSDNYNPPCYYLRGLQPKAKYGLGAGTDLQSWVGDVQIHTDGSGGERSSDPRFRRCGWA